MVAVRRTLPAPPELQGRWAAVLEEAGLRPRILQLHDRYPEERSLEVPFPAIDSADTGLADLLLERPDEVVDAGERAMRELLPVAGPEADGLRLRVIELPPTAHRLIRAIRETDLNRLVAIDGIVRRVSEVRPQIRDAVFECVSCRTKFHEPQDEASLIFREPLECPEAQGGCGKTQGRTRFRLVAEESTYLDAQRIEVQEHPESLKHGAHPQGLSVLLTEDLTGKVLPGNRIVLNGVLKSFQRASASRGGVVRNTTFDLMVLANSFESKTQEYAEIELSPEEVTLIESFRGDPTVVDKIVLSLAPTIKGMEEEKEAIALQLFGGVEKRHSDGVRVRGDAHVLIVGDPGTAKSQLLRYIADVAPRGIYTSGKGATAAGLTAAAVKDDFAGGRWVLEAGMLVLADGGMAIIDELDKMSPEDRSAMHEALEQQSYHPTFELMLYNGEPRPIGPLVDGLFARYPERVLPGADCEILPVRDLGLALLGTDFKGLHRAPVDRVSRHAAPDTFLRVGFANGRSVVVTPGHPMFRWSRSAWSTVPAERLRVGDLAPGVSEYPRERNEAVLRAPDAESASGHPRYPTGFDPSLARLLGLWAGSTATYPAGREPTDGFAFVHRERALAAEVAQRIDATFGAGLATVGPVIAAPGGGRPRRWAARVDDSGLLGYLEVNFPELARDGSDRRVPPGIFHATEACRREFLAGAYRVAGFADARRIGLSAPSRALAEDYADLLLSLGIRTRLVTPRAPAPDRRHDRARLVVLGAASRRRFFDLVAHADPREVRIRHVVALDEARTDADDRVPREFARRLVRLSHRGTGTGGSARGPVRTSRLGWAEFAASLAEIERRWDRTPPAGPSEADRAELHALRALATPPFRPTRVVSVERVRNSSVPFVYDVTVEPAHTFVGQGVVLHNSVSIAKAGITSTLNARCPVLAAANPKWGRFTNDRSIAEQIDLPPTLLSRFDVIFSIKDLPDQTRDRRLANRILASHQMGAGPTAGTGEATAPPFSPDLLKKYIAYAKRNVRPILSDAALSELEDYYVRVRRQGEEPNAPVPITARQLEALVRLSEAAARARLSSVVEVDDARRATRIMENFLKRVSMTEEGKLDIDLTQGGVSHSQRERFDIAQRVMRELQEAHDGYFTVEQYHEAMEKAEVPRAKADAILQTLRNQGEIIEARPNQLQLVRF